jgi:hypothetical protein
MQAAGGGVANGTRRSAIEVVAPLFRHEPTREPLTVR